MLCYLPFIVLAHALDKEFLPVYCLSQIFSDLFRRLIIFKQNFTAYCIYARPICTPNYKILFNYLEIGRSYAA